MWRIRKRFVMRGDRVVYVRDYPLRWPFPRAVPKDLELRAASHWKFYARHHADAVAAIDGDPGLHVSEVLAIHWAGWRHVAVVPLVRGPAVRLIRGPVAVLVRG